jgi:hypothetical protein
MRGDILTLWQQHPKLARLFSEIRDQLDAPISQVTPSPAERDPVALQAEMDQRRMADWQLPRLLEEIRSQPRFKRFLLSASEAKMREAATYGPIIIFNVSSHRCDALIIEPSEIQVLELHRLSRQDILKRAQDLHSLETLGWLWDIIICPVLDFLGFTEPPSDGHWQRVWWIPTGPLVGFPLHAAGYHRKRSAETALDRVVSSYSSSIKAIIHSLQPWHQEQTAKPCQDVILISMPHTPEQAPLQYASDEINAVKAVCESMGLPIIQPQVNQTNVLAALKTCQIFHFAGHGGIKNDPLQSFLLLRDWKQHPLKVANLLETNLSVTSPFLAYLSACGTG